MTRDEAEKKSAELFAQAKTAAEQIGISVREFCRNVDITRASYYNFCRDGTGPSEFYHVANLMEFVKENPAPKK